MNLHQYALTHGYHPFPREERYFSIGQSTWYCDGGKIPYALELIFLLPYPEWCELEKSEAYRTLTQYISDLGTRYKLNKLQEEESKEDIPLSPLNTNM